MASQGYTAHLSHRSGCARGPAICAVPGAGGPPRRGAPRIVLRRGLRGEISSESHREESALLPCAGSLARSLGPTRQPLARSAPLRAVWFFGSRADARRWPTGGVVAKWKIVKRFCCQIMLAGIRAKGNIIRIASCDYDFGWVSMFPDCPDSSCGCGGDYFRSGIDAWRCPAG